MAGQLHPELERDRDSDSSAAREEVIASFREIRNKWPGLELRGFGCPDPGLHWPPQEPGQGRFELHASCDLESAAETSASVSSLPGFDRHRMLRLRLVSDLVDAFEPYLLENDLHSVVFFVDRPGPPDAELRQTADKATTFEPALREFIEFAEVTNASLVTDPWRQIVELTVELNSLPLDFVEFRAAWRRLFGTQNTRLVTFFWDSPTWTLKQANFERLLELPWSAQRDPDTWLSLSDLLDPGLEDEAVEPQRQQLKQHTDLERAAPASPSAHEPDVLEQATLPKAPTTAPLVEIIAAKAPALAERLKQHHRGPATAEEIRFLRDAFAQLRAVGVYPTIQTKDEVRAEIMGVLQAVGARLACPGSAHPAGSPPVPAVLSVNRVTRRGSFFFSHLRQAGDCKRHLPVGSAEADRLPLLEPIPWKALPAGRRPKPTG